METVSFFAAASRRGKKDKVDSATGLGKITKCVAPVHHADMKTTSFYVGVFI